MAILALPEGKWFTVTAQSMVDKAEHRRNLDFKDSYRFSSIIQVLGDEIMFCLSILDDAESIPREFHPVLRQAIESSFQFGRWPGELTQKATIITAKYA